MIAPPRNGLQRGILAATVPGLLFWLMLGAGIAWAVVEDNVQTRDILVIGGFCGVIYTGITAAVLALIGAWYDQAGRPDTD